MVRISRMFNLAQPELFQKYLLFMRMLFLSIILNGAMCQADTVPNFLNSGSIANSVLVNIVA